MRRAAVRQTVVLVSIFSMISVIAWGGTYWIVQREMYRAVDDRLAARLERAVTALRKGNALPSAGDGETIEIGDLQGPTGFWTDPKEGAETRYLRRETPFGVILLSEDTERQEELRDMLAVGMQVSLLGSLLAAALAGGWMAVRAQRRLNLITDGLADVARGQLDRRIDLPGEDDLTLLVDRINATNARLEQAMTDMRVQSSNIAHDLRTPLARLRAQIETALLAMINTARPVSEDDLGEALDQIDRITGTFEALLRLSRIESGAGRSAFRSVALDRLIAQVEETYRPVVEAAGHRLVIDQTAPAEVSGDVDMLVQLLANLIQNALRYGPSGQVITVQCFGTTLAISDQGPGIPFADRDRVLQPLFQGETARQGQGFGLGLSLVRAIADLHAADLSLTDGPNGVGLTVKLRFAQGIRK